MFLECIIICLIKINNTKYLFLASIAFIVVCAAPAAAKSQTVALQNSPTLLQEHKPQAQSTYGELEQQKLATGEQEAADAKAANPPVTHADPHADLEALDREAATIDRAFDSLLGKGKDRGTIARRNSWAPALFAYSWLAGKNKDPRPGRPK